MKPIPVLGIPHLNQRDLLLRCIRSIDYPVEMLVIVDNGRYELSDSVLIQTAAGANAAIRCLCHIWHPNAGVAGSWNEVIKLFPADYWMLANDDIQFTPGDLEKMVKAAEDSNIQHSTLNIEHRIPNGAGMVYGNHGASWFAITRPGVEAVGLFDENLWPAYLEDCDWGYRADLAGIRRVTVPDCHAIHGTATDGADGTKGSRTVNSDPRLAEANMRTHGRNFEYYRAKWGGNNGEEKFQTPFNDPHWPIAYWRFDPLLRAKQMKEWEV